MKTILLTCLILLVSCSTKIDYHMPLNRFDTPEVSGKFLKGSVEWNISKSHKVTLGEVWTDYVIFHSSTTFTDQYIEDSINWGNFSFELGLLPFLDFYQDTPWDSASFSGVKIQLFGSSRLESTEGYKLAVKLGVGTNESDKESNTYTSPDDSSTSNVESTTKLSAYEASIIFGHRSSKKLITYVNAFYQYYEVKANLVKDGTEEINTSGLSRNYGLLLGSRYGDDVHLSLEGGIAKSTYESISKTSPVIGGEIGFSW